MPEQPELRIMSNYINNFNDLTFSKIEIPDRGSLKPPFARFKIKAQNRGKEIIITCFNEDKEFCVKFTMGMTGNFLFSKKKAPKYTRLSFVGKEKLNLVDMRKFAKWKNECSWGKNRGPDPVDEFEKFWENLERGLIEDEAYFRKVDLGEMLLNQKYLNGIGNYLRAEILYSLKLSPKINALKYFSTGNREEKIQIITTACISKCDESFEVGGGQLRDWTNPFRVSKEKFDKWQKVYSKGESYIDNTGRRMWWDPKIQQEIK